MKFEKISFDSVLNDFEMVVLSGGAEVTVGICIAGCCGCSCGNCQTGCASGSPTEELLKLNRV